MVSCAHFVEEELNEGDDEVLRRRIGHSRADGFGGADDHQQTAPGQAEFTDQDRSIRSDGVQKHHLVTNKKQKQIIETISSDLLNDIWMN